MPSYRTLKRQVDLELEKIKGSRFWAFARPVGDEPAAQAFVAELRELHGDAGHHCHAWKLREGGRTRSSDDGEPGGSAGAPILREVEASGLTDVCVVVLRWFGGTKLGTGGLVRAYGGAARAVLAEAPTREVLLTRPLRLRFDYPDTAAVESLLRARDLSAQDSEYGERVALTLAVPLEELEGLEGELKVACPGRIELERGPEPT